jgi:uncharacterized protein YbcI
MEGEGSSRGRGDVVAEISNGLVALHMKYYGKGPREAKTHLVDDTVICILREGFTSVEQTLIEADRGQTVRDMRANFHGVKQDEFIEVVESATGRSVTAYMSQLHMGPDLAVEIFLLGPEGAE